MLGDVITLEEFQSTRPVKGATAHDRDAVEERAVSIHAPREGRDASTATAM